MKRFLALGLGMLSLLFFLRRNRGSGSNPLRFSMDTYTTDMEERSRKPPAWERDEFEMLLRHPNMSSEDMRNLMPRRSAEDIEEARAFVHTFHLGTQVAGVPALLRSQLENKSASLTCPVCSASF